MKGSTLRKRLKEGLFKMIFKLRLEDENDLTV